MKIVSATKQNRMKNILDYRVKHYETLIEHKLLNSHLPHGASSRKEAYEEVKHAFKLVEQRRLSWALPQIKAGRFTDKLKPPRKPYTNYGRGCYYNALSYAHQHAGVELCVGLLFENSWFDQIEKYKAIKDTLYVSPYDTGWSIEHGFVLDGDTVIDPTLGMSEVNVTYVYQIIPKSVWMKFDWSPEAKTNWDSQGFDAVEDYFKTAMSSASKVSFKDLIKR